MKKWVTIFGRTGSSELVWLVVAVWAIVVVVGVVVWDWVLERWSWRDISAWVERNL